MTLPAPTYDLVLLLDSQAEEDARAKIVADARAAIDAQGELLRYDEWGERALTYPIDRKANAEYHLFQFHAGSPDLLNGLNRTLRITDGILRFRIIKLKPGVPEAPDMSSGAVRRSEAETALAGEAPGETAEPAVEAPPAVEALPASEPVEDVAAEAPVAETPVSDPA
jgi:small subunit ribosomal protein S6